MQNENGNQKLALALGVYIVLGLQRAGTARQRICRNEKCVCRPELKGRNYIDRLNVCKLPTLHYKRIRGDMIDVSCTISSRSSPASCGYITSFWRFFERNPICSSVGTRLDNSSFRIATALRCAICAPHQCVCGENVDQYGVHGLSCRRSAGRHSRHSAVNDLIKRALTAAEIPARLEPSCLSRNDGKRPDGLTLVPWSHGRCLVWDFTCPDTLAISHLHRASIAACTVAVDAEERKRAKYTALCDQYCFVPLAVETLGALGEEAATFLRDIGRRIAVAAGEWRAAIHSVSVECSNV